MDRLLFAWILMLSSLLVEVSGQPSASLPAITDETFINDCVDAHNKARSSVQPPASDMLHMTWDEGLAITARAWARNCEFRHNIHLSEVRRVHPVFSSVGENIWTGPLSIFGTKSAIDLFVNEKEYYTYNTMACAKAPCGHYTQVVWASSYKVGCAVQHCPNGVKYTDYKDGAVFVCNYATAHGMKAWPSPQGPGRGTVNSNTAPSPVECILWDLWERTYGQATPPSTFGTKSAIGSWVDEKEYYTYTTMACAKPPCGHYTQVVWASSYKVGCAVQHCPNGVKYTDFKDGAVFVCNYATAGNYLGQRPYTEDTTLTSCGTSCLAVLIIRPLALICTFAAAFTVNPNIFCYE